MSNSTTIIIGNSDNKLGQSRWSMFVKDCERVIFSHVEEHGVHFSGGPSTDKPWQNFCWVIETPPEETFADLLAAIMTIRQRYAQEGVAVISGACITI